MPASNLKDDSEPDPSVPPLRTTPRVLLSLAWPIVLSRSAQVVVGVCDAVMVKHLGDAAVAATTTGAMNTFNTFILPMGTVFIVSSYASQLKGAGKPEVARRYGTYGLFVALAAAVFSAMLVPFIPWILGHFDQAPEVRDATATYMQIRLWSAGAAVGMETLANYYGGLGNTRLPAIANVLAMVLNVLGNWVLIDGHLGAPAMGVRGAALASALSTGAAFAFLFWRFGADGRAAGTPMFRGLARRELFRMLRFGIPSGLNWFFEFLAFTFFVNVVFGGLGVAPQAAFMSVIQINSVSFMPAFGVASAGAILAGQQIGAKAFDEVPRTVRVTFLTNACWQGLVGLSYVVIPEALLANFHDPKVGSAEFLTVGARVLQLSAAWQLFDSAASTLAETLRAAGDTTYTLVARLIIAWGVFVPGSLVTVKWLHGKEVGATAWLVAYMALLAIVLFLRFRRGAWRHQNLTGAAEVPI